MTNSMAIRPDQTQWTDQQKALLVAAGVKPANAAQAQLFLAYCQRTGLDPVARQIFLLQGQAVVSIDGMRLVAQRSGEYRGQVGPQWCGTDGQWQDVWVADGPPAAARVGVLREGFTEAVWGVALWREFGSNRGQWSKMPGHMLAKVAESHALRKAFPNDLGGLYSSDEMGSGATQQPMPDVPKRPEPTPEPTPEPDHDDLIVDAEVLDPEEA